MTKEQLKMQQLLIDIGKKTEQLPPQSLEGVEAIYRDFILGADVTGKRRQITNLCAALAKLAIDNC